MTITENIKYIGVNDKDITLFERQYPVKNGMSYNSYLIRDEKTTVMDAVEIRFAEEWLQNIENICGNAAPDFLVIQHMEPDHSAGIQKFMEKYPQAQLIASAKAFTMIKQFFGMGYENRRIVVKEGDCICLGQHTLTFIEAPMIHWPEVIMTYEKSTKTFFSADAFGKFGALDVEDAWTDEARRYYINIVGKYGAQVNILLKKAANLNIRRICPLHGPVLEENLPSYLKLYQTWASYEPESDGILIAYTSMYGNTEKAAVLLTKLLKERGCSNIALRDLTLCDMSEAVSTAFRYGKIVLATTTYNGGIFPRMREFIEHLTERNYQNRKIGLIENGSWAPTAARNMKNMFEKMRNISFYEPVVTISSALSDDSSTQLSMLAEACTQLGEDI